MRAKKSLLDSVGIGPNGMFECGNLSECPGIRPPLARAGKAMLPKSVFPRKASPRIAVWASRVE